MSSAISAIANARISPWVPGSTRAFAAGGNNSGAEAASSGVDVLLSSRMDRLLQDFGSATSNTNDQIAGLSTGSGRQASAETFGASDLRYSPTDEVSGADYGSNVDTVGGPSDTMERVLDGLRRMGQDAVRAQANQLPTGAMS